MKNLILLIAIFLTLSARAQQEYVTEKDLSYYPESVTKEPYQAERCKLDIYYPKGVRDFPTIVWFHGGGLTGGSKEIPKALMDKGYAIIGVNYRLAPKAKSPAFIDDAAAAVAWAFRHIEKYGGNTKLIFISGHSAGGYLALLVGLNKKYLQKYDIDANRIAALIPFSPQVITHFTIRAENGLKDTQPVIDQYAPLYYVRADAPPLILVTGDREMELLGRYEENAYMNRMMKLAGHKKTTLYELDGFDHGAMAEPAFPLLRKEINLITKEVLDKK